MAETTTNTRILVGVDGSDSSIAALQEAGKLATALDAPLAAICVWDYPAVVEYYSIPGWSPADEAARMLNVAIEKAFGDSPPSKVTTTTVRGSTARTLIQESKEARMLVLGSRGHGGFVGMLLGSVSAACAQHARCPVLIVRTPGSSAASSHVDEAAERQEQK
jgi:nucleotide-binding universal stress UspA family protein